MPVIPDSERQLSFDTLAMKSLRVTSPKRVWSAAMLSIVSLLLGTTECRHAIAFSKLFVRFSLIKLII